MNQNCQKCKRALIKRVRTPLCDPCIEDIRASVGDMNMPKARCLNHLEARFQQEWLGRSLVKNRSISTEYLAGICDG